jgi:hypothetical protein
MWEITATDRITLKRIRVAIADSYAELRLILWQERNNYHGLKYMRIA